MTHEATTPLLERLRARGIIDAAQHAALMADSPPPWWLAALLGFAAWFASLFILASFFGPLLALGDGAAARAIGGAILIAAALALFRRGGLFTAQMGLAFSLAGQALLVFALAGRIEELLRGSTTVAIAGIAIATGMMLPRTTVLHRTICALVAIAHLAGLIGPGAGLASLGVTLAALAAALWLTRSRWAAHRHAPAVKAAAHAATLAALCIAPYGNAQSALELAAGLLGPDRPAAVPAIFAVGAPAVLLATVLWLTREADPFARLMAAGAALVFAAAAYPAPGLIVGAALAIAAFHACHRAWTLLALGFTGLYVAEFYYSLHATLLEKSLALAAAGAVLLALRAGLRSLEGRTA